MVWAVGCSLWPALGYTTGPKMECLFEIPTRAYQKKGVSENGAHPRNPVLIWQIMLKSWGVSPRILRQNQCCLGKWLCQPANESRPLIGTCLLVVSLCFFAAVGYYAYSTRDPNKVDAAGDGGDGPGRHGTVAGNLWNNDCLTWRLISYSAIQPLSGTT